MNSRLFYCISIVVSLLFVSCVQKGYQMKPQRTVQNSAVLPSALQKKLEKGIVFYASGNVPTPWFLEVDAENKILFSALDKNLKTPILTQVDKPAYKQYLYIDRSGNLDFKIFDTSCTGMNKDKNALQQIKTEVTVDGVFYSGCGQYLLDNKLQGSWALQQYNEKVLLSAEFSGKFPQMILSLDDNTISVFDGCKTIKSTIVLKGNRMQILSPTNVLSDCIPPIIGTVFSNRVFDKSLSYFFKNGLLYFYLIDDGLLIFKAVPS